MSMIHLKFVDSHIPPPPTPQEEHMAHSWWGGWVGGYTMQLAITRTRKGTLLAYSVTLRQCVLN